MRSRVSGTDRHGQQLAALLLIAVPGDAFAPKRAPLDLRQNGNGFIHVLDGPGADARQVFSMMVPEYIKVDSVDAAVDAIARIDQIDRAACRAAVSSRFTVDLMADRYLSLYRSILG